MALITVLRSSRGRVHISMYKCITEKYKRNTAVTLLLSCIIKKNGALLSCKYRHYKKPRFLYSYILQSAFMDLFIFR